MRGYLSKERDVERWFAVMDAVNALPEKFDSMDEQAAAVARIFEGCGVAVWREFDERSYMRTNTRFHLVRQVRNHPTAHKVLFEAVGRKPTAAAPSKRRKTK